MNIENTSTDDSSLLAALYVAIATSLLAGAIFATFNVAYALLQFAHAPISGMGVGQGPVVAWIIAGSATLVIVVGYAFLTLAIELWISRFAGGEPVEEGEVPAAQYPWVKLGITLGVLGTVLAAASPQAVGLAGVDLAVGSNDYLTTAYLLGPAVLLAWPGVGMDEKNTSADDSYISDSVSGSDTVAPKEAAIIDSKSGQSQENPAEETQRNSPESSESQQRPEMNTRNTPERQEESTGEETDAPTTEESTSTTDSEDFQELAAGHSEYNWEFESEMDFSDVGGMDEYKDILDREIIEPLQGETEKYEAFGISVPNVLMHGPPGTGKTFLAEGMIGELGYPYLITSGGDITSKWINESSSRVTRLFVEASTIAEEMGGAVIFIDEIDAVLPDRENSKSTHQEDTKVVDEFLNQLGSTPSGVVVVGATNTYDTLDEAAVRPGRFDRKFHVDLPDAETRAGMLEAQLEARPRGDITKADIDRIAEDMVEATAADIESVVEQAAFSAVNREADGIDLRDIVEAQEDNGSL